MQTSTRRPPSHPGEILREEFLKPLGVSQSELARDLDVSVRRVNAIANERRAVSAETAVLLSKRFRNSAEFWMNHQIAWDLWHARKKLAAAR